MITNLLATIMVSIVTNWTDIHMPVFEKNAILCDQQMQWNGWQFVPQEIQGKLIGKDGLVVKVTEIKFRYENKPQIHRIEEPLEKITMRCHERPPIPQEPVWDAPVREKIGESQTNADMIETNPIIILDSIKESK